ncbi:hypothetical protein EJB05_23555, partial [Eragrostis curvula]
MHATFLHLFSICANSDRTALVSVQARVWVRPHRLHCAASARRVFDAMHHWYMVSWNNMLTAYSHVGDIEAALALFHMMPDPNDASWNTLVSSYC